MGIILICAALDSISDRHSHWAATARFRGDAIIGAMCVQCMVTAMSSVAAASGTRAWLGRKRAEWLTPKLLRLITVALFIGAVLVAGTMSGSS
jgi:hypothetical protein